MRFLASVATNLRNYLVRARQLLAEKAAQTIIYFLLLALLPYLVPGFNRWRILMPAKIAGYFNPQTSNLPRAAVAISTFSAPGQISANAGEIEDASGHALDHFFAALGNAEIDRGVVRICHYGDSQIINDHITSTLREKFQSRFGDAGHGFVLAGKPWSWYEHKGVLCQIGSEWQPDPMILSKPGDHKYGLGGARFIAKSAGAAASFATAPTGQRGDKVSTFDIYYLAHPGGGAFDIDLDGRQYARVATANDRSESGFYLVKAQNGAHKMTLKTAGNGEAQIYGVVMEAAGPGVVYDSLGVNAASIDLFDHFLDAENWSEQLRHRHPNLVIIATGVNEQLAYVDLTNEVELGRKILAQYDKETRELIGRLRAILPDASIMLIGPLDRGNHNERGEIDSHPMIPIINSYQRRIAAETGCAFFDTFRAMGGAGTAAKWSAAHPKLMGGDYIHPTEAGAEIVGDLIYQAFINSYERYKMKIAKTE